MMAGGTLFVSRAVLIHSWIKTRLEQLGFNDVTVTGAEKDALNMEINKVNPRLLLIAAGFYELGTPHMAGELYKRFPQLNIAAVAVHDYPVSSAVWFKWYGIQSYVSFWEGDKQFYQGLQMIRQGKQYISPMVQNLIDNSGEWPDTNNKMTKRHRECLLMLCSGYVPERIGEKLHISRKTVHNHLDSLYKVFHVKSREEMVALAWQMGLVAPEDVRFYDRKNDYSQLPDWAAAKMRMNKIKAEEKL